MLKKTLSGLSGNITKRIGKFKTMAEETQLDINELGVLKEKNEERLKKISEENTEIDDHVAEAEGFVAAINNMFGFKKEEVNG